MRVKTKPTIITLYVVMITGCATPGTSTINYAPPQNFTTIQNEIIVSKPFEAVWDSFVRELAKGFYVVNKLDKQSRVVTLSFSTNTPEEYVDCGIITRTYSRGNHRRTYKYQVASASAYIVAGSTGVNKKLPQTAVFSRRLSLEGGVNIYVAPEDQNTRVSVNIRYFLTSKVEGTYTTENRYRRRIQSGTIPAQTFTSVFNTNQPVIVTMGTPQRPLEGTCQSLGRLEKDILQLAQ